MDIKTLKTPDDGPENPYDLFHYWYDEAKDEEINDPNAMCLATSNAENQPSARMVLLKDIDERGFVFFTNTTSRKGQDLVDNQKVALCFHWKTLRKQVRVEGTVSFASDSQADAYFNSRHPRSRRGSWASDQSSELESRDMLIKRVEAFEDKYPDDDNIPRPPYWTGYRVDPHSIEYWHDGDNRLHTRLLYTLTNGEWDRKMLYP